jgi:hypothetical protein
VLEGETADAHRHSGDHEQPRQPLLWCVGAALADRGNERGDDPEPRLAEVREQGEGGGDVKATTKARKNDSSADCHRERSYQPNQSGRSTVWPRLEIGTSPVTPWRRPSTIAWN